VIHLQRILATGMLAAMIAGCGQSTTFEMSDGESLVWEDLRGDGCSSITGPNGANPVLKRFRN